MKTKQKKMNARVDFTPMVDMMMLLVTFFMLCTTLAKPQTMEIAMPTNKTEEKNRSQVDTKEAVTVILDENNRVFYYKGKPADAPQNIREVYYLSEQPKGDLKSLHEVLKKANPAYEKAEKIRKEYEARLNAAMGAAKGTQDAIKAEFDEKFNDAKAEKGTPQIIIKPTDGSTYNNLIEVLDEMSLCNIGKYVIVPIDEGDKAVLDGYKANH
ncbi:MAG: biopolymer transporter ExbD [Prevotellaceae bacterium]|nr:biopolymer transporter ExbD [Prevotellaceae bacterium]